MRIFDNRQSVLPADPVGYFTEFSLLCFGIVVFLPVQKGNRIEAKMIVQMVFIKVGSDDDLPTFPLPTVNQFYVPVRV